MSKQDQNAPSAAFTAALAAISKTAVDTALATTARNLGMDKTVSADQYGMLIAGMCIQLKLNTLSAPAEFGAAFGTAWQHCPKNPSAMRQALFERKTESTTAPASKWAHLLSGEAPASEG